jgi:hypothetical protein
MAGALGDPYELAFVSVGLLSEIVSRTHYESQNMPIYVLGDVKSHGKEVGHLIHNALSPRLLISGRGLASFSVVHPVDPSHRARHLRLP